MLIFSLFLYGEFFIKIVNYDVSAKHMEKQENVLDKKTIDNIKKELIEREKQVTIELEEISSNGGKKVKFPEYGSKSDENAQEIDEYTKNVATEKVLESSLKDIRGALKRIDDGTYGSCKYCKNEIGKKRMLARPVASACMDCKTKLQNL